jgi:hypothetical protein
VLKSAQYVPADIASALGNVRRGELKDQSPDAVDISDLKTAQDVGTRVEAERRIIEMERKRLLPTAT